MLCGTKLRILCADDDVIVHKITDRIFESINNDYKAFITLEHCYDGEELVRLVISEGNSYDYILTDNSMPKKTGGDAIREISVHNVKLLDNITLISSDNDLDKIHSDLKFSRMQKPVGKDDIINILVEYLQNNKQ